ncbi:superinfection immunity protein [Hymenobacter sp. UYP22]|uniref:superinfection immunity protein n=1 Tax=Hymenobacter sp. UYP22 TaxID=3156348 RepID=UPI003393751F
MVLLDTYEAGYTLGKLIGGFLTIVLMGGIYFLPSIIGRKKRQAMSIFALNLLLGWTVLGWIGALIWAMSSDTPQVVVKPVVHTPVSVADELTKLQALRENGTLSETEYQQQRQRLLNQPA